MMKLVALGVLVLLGLAAARVLAEDPPKGDGSGKGGEASWGGIEPGRTTSAELEARVGPPARRYRLKVPKEGYDLRLDHPMATADDPLAPKPDPSVPRVDAEVWVYPTTEAAVQGRPVFDTRVVVREGKVAYLRTWPRADEETLPLAKARHGKHPFTAQRKVFELDLLITYDEYAWRASGVVLFAEAKGDEETRRFKIKLLVPAQKKEEPPK